MLRNWFSRIIEDALAAQEQRQRKLLPPPAALPSGVVEEWTVDDVARLADFMSTGTGRKLWGKAQRIHFDLMNRACSTEADRKANPERFGVVPLEPANPAGWRDFMDWMSSLQSEEMLEAISRGDERDPVTDETPQFEAPRQSAGAL